MTTRSESSRSGKPHAANANASRAKYYSDLERFHALRDEDIDLSDLPELDEEWFSRAEFVPGNPRLIRQFPVTAPEDVSEWFESAPEGRDEAVLAALREYMERHPREPQTG
jgi:hypothetical protein